jgi:signal transduction histidine kinase
VARLRAVLRSRRLRVALLAVVVTGAVLALLDVGMVTLQRRALDGPIESSAESDVTRALTLLRSGAPEADLLSVPSGNMIEVVNAKGVVVLADHGLRGMPALQVTGHPSEDDPNITVGTLERLPSGLSGPFLVTSAHFNSSKATGPGTVFVVASLRLAELSQRTAGIDLGIGSPLLVLLAGLITWVVTGHMLRPVETIRARTADLARRDPSQRVAEAPEDSEVAPLARSMNELLGQLEASAARQRRFVADASHELRSPLTAIQAQLDVSLAHPEQVNWVTVAGAIMGETLRMQRIVEDLLLLASTDEATLPMRHETVDLDDLALAEARRLRNRGRVRVDASGVSAARVVGDHDRLTQVVRNLATNAERHATHEVRLEVYRTDGEAVLVVGDDGPGIPPEDRERVFERFTRLDEARSPDRGGAGLGLAIARSIVQAHGGSITVADPQPGDPGRQGARLKVRLPAAGEEPAAELG